MSSLPFDFDLIQTPEGLERLDREFLELLGRNAPQSARRLLARRHGDDMPGPVELSALVLDVAPHLETFLAGLFGIKAELERSRQATVDENAVAALRGDMVMRRSRKLLKRPPAEGFAELDRWLTGRLAAGGFDDPDRERAVARLAAALVADENGHAQDIERLAGWCARAQLDAEGRAATAHWSSFRLPRAVDHAHLVPMSEFGKDPVRRREAPVPRFRQRDGFHLTDPRMSARDVQVEIDYCVFCHDHDGDFCSKGFPEKKQQPELGLKVNPLGVTLTGCPLEEKISEMHLLKRDGRTIAALAVAMIDNPMIPATGHRICNDCMKACIYQKRDPVNIPQIETRVLTDVLELPWGVEIYDLLARWNPMRRRQYRMKPWNGRRVLVSGLGPAGFTMVHHLTMEGCAVVGIDGLKIEPMPDDWRRPVRDYQSLCEPLDSRILTGFGGVAEYGITVRWDKNFLNLIYLTLARRRTFQAFGGVRLGGTVTIEDAWQLGFDHVSVAHGAGLPRVISIGNSLARGMRQANDFLMALQLTGAAKSDSLANLQVRLPAVVIGGGLTAVDTATEIQAYYLRQVEKVLYRYERLVEAHGEAHVLDGLDEEHRGVLAEFLDHGRALREERRQAAAEERRPDFVSLLRSWGGVTIVYRRGINESPAYQRNHEELIKALEEGIYYAEGLNPNRIELDAHGHVRALLCCRMKQQDGRWLRTNEPVEIPAHAVLVAAGTVPNTIYENEHPGTLLMEGSHFLPHVEHRDVLQPVRQAEHCKAPEFGPFTSYQAGPHRVSFLGDTHPVFNGSVVKAIASASRSYPEIMAAIDQAGGATRDSDSLDDFRARMADQFEPRVESVDDRHPIVTELWVRAPLAARNFRPGQFFRLQTFERLSPVVAGTRLQIPLQTISGAGVDGERIRLMLLRWGANARIASRLVPGDRLVLMGPTGKAVEEHSGRTYLVVAGSWGAAVMLHLGPFLHAAGNRVLYLAAYGSRDEVYSQAELENCADRIIWAVARGPVIEPGRAGDLSVVNGNVIDLLRQYGEGRLAVPDGAAAVPLAEVDEVLVMGSTGLLKALQEAFRPDGPLARSFRPDVHVTGTVGSPMQCMLKGVCAQCLQWQIDPETGERTRAVFSCSMQDQPLMWIDIDNLAARQGQTRLMEHLTNLWVDHVLEIEADQVRAAPGTGAGLRRPAHGG